MPYWVYILKCFKNHKFRCFYTGQTNNLRRRFSEHIENVKFKDTDKFTGRFDFVKRVWYKKVSSRAEALKLERYIKGLSHYEKRAWIRRR